MSVSIIRSSCSQIFFKGGIFIKFSIFTGKYLCWSLFLIKLQAYNFIKKRLHHRCFHMNIAKFLKTLFLQSTFDGCFCIIPPCLCPMQWPCIKLINGTVKSDLIEMALDKMTAINLFIFQLFFQKRRSFETHFLVLICLCKTRLCYRVYYNKKINTDNIKFQETEGFYKDVFFT